MLLLLLFRVCEHADVLAIESVHVDAQVLENLWLHYYHVFLNTSWQAFPTLYGQWPQIYDWKA